jgi:hypothetical protein
MADGEPLEGVQPREAVLDHPALRVQAGAVDDAAAGDPGVIPVSGSFPR